MLKNINEETLDQILRQTAARLAKLPNKSTAAIYAACTERLFPLFQSFTEKEAWGDCAETRNSLDNAWELLTQDSVDRDLAYRIVDVAERMMPHADDFASFECIFAQDVCVLLDSTARSLLSETVNPQLIEYAFEGIRAAICEEKTGFMDLGDSEGAADFERFLITDPRIKREIENQKHDLDLLQEATEVNRELIESIRRRSHSRPWTSADFSWE